MPVPLYPANRSAIIKRAVFDKFRIHAGCGDMWPITWADDGHLYGAAGDNSGSPMNFWRILGDVPARWANGSGWGVYLELIDNMPIDPHIYCQKPGLDQKNGVKPAGLLSIDGVLFLAVELHNYGDNLTFNRQHNLSTWIITSADHGQNWNRDATPQDFFTGRLASPHFVQFGCDYAGARDDYVYASFSAGDDGGSYWENGDYLLLGRVKKERILDRTSWEFYTGHDSTGNPLWSLDDANAVETFRYPLMTGENHVIYNPGIKRYLMGSYGFLDAQGNPRPYHSPNVWPESCLRSQLTLFEAPEPWGPWSLFHQDDDWGTYGDYQPIFPTKWISKDGLTLLMVSSGSFDDYNFTVQKVALELF